MKTRARSTGTARASTPTHKLPAALAKRAAGLVAKKRKRLLVEARSLVALVKRRKAQIAELFYDIGEALRRLKDREMLAVLGFTSFDRMCDERLGLSSTVADRLVDIVTRISRDDALSMGQSKAMALVELAAATPEADTPAGLLRGTALALPGGKILDPKKASARAIERGAKAIRQARAEKPRKGRTTSAEERAAALALQRELHARGVRGAKVTAVATKPGKGSNVRVEHVPLESLGVLGEAIARVLGRR